MSEENTNEEKKSFVGPKRVLMTFKGDQTPFEVSFPTSIAYHKGIRAITEEPEDANVVVKKGLNRTDVESNYVTSAIYPASELTLRKSSKTVIHIELVFELGIRYQVPIAGENRMRIAYKRLQDIIGKTPDEENLWIEVNQEENKKAFIKHINPLIAIRTIVPDGAESEEQDD